MFGTVGTGKTFAAACIVNALIDKQYPCLMTNLPRVLNQLRGMRDGKQEYLDNLNRVTLLVIDDYTTEAATDYAKEVIHDLIDARYRSRLPLIVTTNYTGEQLKNCGDIFAGRLNSRLFEMCIPVEVNGEDRRKHILRDSYEEYKELLGINNAKNIKSTKDNGG